MTPVIRAQIIRSSLQAILQGEGALEQRIDAVVESLSKLAPRDRKAIATELAPKLARALRSRSAQISSATELTAELYERLTTLAQSQGALIVERKITPELIASYQLQLGDNRTDYSTQARLHQFNK